MEPLQVIPTFDPWSHRYFLGVDFGKAADYTALTIIERRGDAKAGELQVRHLQRWPLQTPYEQIADEICRMLKHPAFIGRPLPEENVDGYIEHLESRDMTAPLPVMAIDYGGVGSAVCEILTGRKPRSRVLAVLITGGHRVDIDEAGVWHVPKFELVGVVQAGLQTGRLRVAEDLPEAALLQDELRNFEMKITQSANVIFNAREGKHDDLVLATALAAWSATSGRLNSEFRQLRFYR